MAILKIGFRCHLMKPALIYCAYRNFHGQKPRYDRRLVVKVVDANLSKKVEEFSEIIDAFSHQIPAKALSAKVLFAKLLNWKTASI